MQLHPNFSNRQNQELGKLAERNFVAVTGLQRVASKKVAVVGQNSIFFCLALAAAKLSAVPWKNQPH